MSDLKKMAESWAKTFLATALATYLAVGLDVDAIANAALVSVLPSIITKLDFWAIAANEVYKACRRAGMDEGTALAFAMDRSSYPDWIVPADDPIKKIGWEDGEEDN